MLAQLRLRVDRLRHAEELVEALREAVAELENGFGEQDRRIAQAAGALVSRMPEFIALGERVYRAYAELRNCRLVVSEIGRLLTLDDRLLHLIECDQESNGRRTLGYSYTKALSPTGLARSPACWPMPMRRYLVAAPTTAPAILLHRLVAVVHHRHERERRRQLPPADPLGGRGRAAANARFQQLLAARRRSPASATLPPASGWPKKKRLTEARRLSERFRFNRSRLIWHVQVSDPLLAKAIRKRHKKAVSLIQKPGCWGGAELSPHPVCCSATCRWRRKLRT